MLKNSFVQSSTGISFQHKVMRTAHENKHAVHILFNDILNKFNLACFVWFHILLMFNTNAISLFEHEEKLHRQGWRSMNKLKEFRWRIRIQKRDLVPCRKLSALADRQHAAGRHGDHRGRRATAPPSQPLRPIIVQLPRRCGLHRWHDAALGQRAAPSEWQVGKLELFLTQSLASVPQT